MKVEEYIKNNLSQALKHKKELATHPVEIHLERPKLAQHGDFSTNIAMLLASLVKKSPRTIAEEIVKELSLAPEIIEKTEVAGPGFINFHLGWGYLREALLDIVQKGHNFGKSDRGGGVKVQIEFVSANPTGPLNVVSARAATVGDVLVNLFNAVGYDACREYYINDAGRQVRLLGASVSARYMELFGLEEEFPEEGYHGDYVKDIARSIAEKNGDSFIHLTKEERQELFTQMALEQMIQSHQKMLTNYGVHFDHWFRESQLRKNRDEQHILHLLREKGLIYEHEGALWFKSSQFGDEKDRVLVTSDGEPTYFLIDIAYHQNKYNRGFQILYDLWGPDHHGYIDRMKAAMVALGYPPESFNVEIIQQVNLLRGGQVVKMSKRAGRLIEMEELINEVGVDAARYFFLERRMSSHLDFDIELAKKQSDENPVYYVQYAHARICNILKFAENKGIPIPQQADLTLLKAEEEKEVIKKLLLYPEVISKSAQFLEPHRLTTYLQELAATFHRFYHDHRVVSEDVALTQARLVLTQATRIVLANGFKILGISAPEKM